MYSKKINILNILILIYIIIFLFNDKKIESVIYKFYSRIATQDIIEARPEISEEIKISPNVERYNNQNKATRAGTGRIMKPFKEVKDSDYRGFTKSRELGNSRKDQTFNPPGKFDKRNDKSYIPSLNFNNKTQKHNVKELERGVSKMNMQDGKFESGNIKQKHNRVSSPNERNAGGSSNSNPRHSANSNNNQRQVSVPPRMQGEPKGSKRYSSIRQRSLPETTNPPMQMQHGNYYPTGK